MFFEAVKAENAPPNTLHAAYTTMKGKLTKHFILKCFEEHPNLCTIFFRKRKKRPIYFGVQYQRKQFPCFES
jgi:hypothetical protein